MRLGKINYHSREKRLLEGNNAPPPVKPLQNNAWHIFLNLSLSNDKIQTQSVEISLKGRGKEGREKKGKYTKVAQMG